MTQRHEGKIDRLQNFLKNGFKICLLANRIR